MALLDDLANVRQLCIVVRDLKEAMRRYHTLFGIGPFKVYGDDALEHPGYTYRGKPANYKYIVAMAQLGDWQLELLEHQRGESIYKDFLDQHGEGVQHIGAVVKDYPAAMAEMARLGFEHIEGGPIFGKNRTGHFDYFDTTATLGVVFEVLDFPEVPLDPIAVYPEE